MVSQELGKEGTQQCKNVSISNDFPRNGETPPGGAAWPGVLPGEVDKRQTMAAPLPSPKPLAHIHRHPELIQTPPRGGPESSGPDIKQLYRCQGPSRAGLCSVEPVGRCLINSQ